MDEHDETVVEYLRSRGAKRAAEFLSQSNVDYEHLSEMVVLNGPDHELFEVSVSAPKKSYLKLGDKKERVLSQVEEAIREKWKKNGLITKLYFVESTIEPDEEEDGNEGGDTDKNLYYFSERYGHQGYESREIKFREDAPKDLREGLWSIIFFRCKMKRENFDNVCWEYMRKYMTEPKYRFSDGAHSNDIKLWYHSCQWYVFYDLIEVVYQGMSSDNDEEIRTSRLATFNADVNDLFMHTGAGWKFVQGRVEVRGDLPFENLVKRAEDLMKLSGVQKAEMEFREALLCMARKPVANLSGAGKHASDAYESVAKYVLEGGPTCGDALKGKRPDFPSMVYTLLEKLWAYCNAQYRHGDEEKIDYTFEETMFVLGQCASAIEYLLVKYKKH